MIISKLKLAISIAISIISALCVFSFVNKYTSYKYVLRPETAQRLNFSLMGQFNFLSQDISTWIDSWSKVFRSIDIVIAAPDNAWHPYPKLTSARYMFYPAVFGT